MKHNLAMIFLSLLMAFGAQAKTIIISDIDDTIRQSDVLNKLDASMKLLGTAESFHSLGSIYQSFADKAEEEGSYLPIAYISASIPLFYNADKWRAEKKLPRGPALQRATLSEDKVKFKKDRIRKFLAEHLKAGDQVLFFGDNGELDPQIYTEMAKELKIAEPKIYIRDIRVENTKYSPEGKKVGMPGVNYFFSEVDLLKLPEFRNIGSERALAILLDAQTQESIAPYVINRIANRLNNCKGKSFLDPNNCEDLARNYIHEQMQYDLRVLQCFYRAPAELIAKYDDEELLRKCQSINPVFGTQLKVLAEKSFVPNLAGCGN